MGILARFTDIISANINALLDKAEDPNKMIDQYLRKMTSDLMDVKRETAAVMAEESRTKRLQEENEKEVAKYRELAKKALLAQNEEDARVFLTKKQELETVGAGLQMAAAVAHENAVKMRQMHDKLVQDINTLNARSQSIKAKNAVAKTQERVTKMSAGGNAEGAMSAIDRMEDRVNRRLDEANSRTDLDLMPIDETQALEMKYKVREIDVSVNNELAELKAEMGLV